MHTSTQEALWVLRAQCDDREALELLLRSVQPAVHRYLCGLVGPADAPDVLQEVLVQVYRQLGWLETPGLFRPWVFRIASRAGFRHLRKERRWREQEREEALLAEIPAPAPPPREGVLSALPHMEGISPASRAVLLLHFQEELSLPEVAAVLELPLGTIKSRLAYGLTALRKQLTKRRNF